MSLPKHFRDRAEVAAVRAEAEQLDPGATDGGTKRRLAGRIMARRDMGKLVFLDLVDRSGRIQLICPAERTGELDLHLGDIVGVTGSPARSRRGEPSLQVDELEVLARIRQPRYGGGFAEPFVTRSELLDAELYLRIADELYLKRLIVGGLEKVYELSKDFRNESYSYKHSPEITQIERYEAYADYRDTAARLKELVRHAAEATIGGTKTTFRG